MKETPKKIKMLREYSTNLTKECPFGTIHQKRCDNCSIAINLFTDEEVKMERSRGNMTVEEHRYACPIYINAIMIANSK